VLLADIMPLNNLGAGSVAVGYLGCHVSV
jgi:hypothetical protein